jgi:hypothetical protein
MKPWPKLRFAVSFGLILWTLFVEAHAQGQTQMSLNFRVTITGFEIVGENRVAVRGAGNLTLSGSSLSYDISVPLRRALPAEAHFHGPAVGGENPIFSLVPYQEYDGFIRYVGNKTFDFKWVQDIREGEWYVQLHGPSYDNGVLRGTIVPVVPEPGAVAIVAIGGTLFCLGAFFRRETH